MLGLGVDDKYGPLTAVTPSHRESPKLEVIAGSCGWALHIPVDVH
jgi:hypothetical protein